MLCTLYIRDFAIIDELEVEFDHGLNILTGQTGAGKSIMVGALKLILGERASGDTIRAGAKKAVIEGVFDPTTAPDLQKLLDDHEIPCQGALILRREIAPTYSRAFINDSPTTLAVMRKVAAQMIDLHGQHEHQSLLRVDTHLNLLDLYGGLVDLRLAYEKRYEQVVQRLKEFEDLKSQQENLEASREKLSFAIEEIDAVAPQEGEEDLIQADIHRYEHAEQLYSVTASLHSTLYEREDSTAEQLAKARTELQDLAQIDPTLQEASKEIDQAYISVTEIAAILQDYNVGVEFNPVRLEELRIRLGELDTLKRKYGGSLDAVLSYRAEIASEYETAVHFDAALTTAQEQLEEAKKSLSKIAFQLSTDRNRVARQIESSITAEFASLGMADGQLHVQILRHKDPSGWITESPSESSQASYKTYRYGVDDVEFLITTNLGEDLRPLARVASGGEISRVMLAIKRVLAKNDRLPILVFDEIDVGISGSIARKVGRSMVDLGKSHQIIAITHLPQIAALAHAHYVVEKHVSDGRTTTGIRRLSEDESLEQVASLITGTEVTEAMRQSARELAKIEGESNL